VSDQHHARARADMPKIRDVQQEFIAGLILDPTMKDWDQSLKVNFFRVLHQQLYVHVLEFHGGMSLL
jgi:hypothetical protein